MDAQALQVLEKRGLGDLTGVSLGKEVRGVFERRTTHAVNGSYGGDERQTWFEGGWGLHPLSDETQVASELFQVDGKSCGPCVTMFVNSLGGRVVVMTYAPWVRLGRASKLFQLKALVDWATQGRMPLHLAANVRITPLVRMNARRTRLAVVLLNNGLDPVDSLVINLRAAVQKVWQVASSGEKIPLPVQASANGVTVTLNALPAWQTAILLGE
jgi:hypothetical protein